MPGKQSLMSGSACATSRGPWHV